MARWVGFEPTSSGSKPGVLPVRRPANMAEAVVFETNAVTHSPLSKRA